MKRITLSDQLSFSNIIQGFWRLGSWNYTPQKVAENIRECLDMGITTFDTAEIYDDTACESLLGEAFATDPSLRGRIELVSKTGIYKQEIDGSPFVYYNTRYDRIKESCKAALKRLHTDHLDLYLIHREDACIDFEQTARALTDLKKEGLILEAGVSNFDPMKFDCLQQAMGGTLVTNQIEWNPVCFEHVNSGMIDYLTLHRIHPMIWSPLAGGRLFTSSEEVCTKAMAKIRAIAERHQTQPDVIVYAWLMHHPVGAMPICGSRNPERAKLAVQAAEIELEHYEWYEIYSASGQQVIR